MPAHRKPVRVLTCVPPGAGAGVLWVCRSAGCVLAELMTGRTLFQGQNSECSSVLHARLDTRLDTRTVYVASHTPCQAVLMCTFAPHNWRLLESCSGGRCSAL